MTDQGLILDAHGHLGDWPATQVIGGDAEGMLVSMDAAGIAATAVSSFQSLDADYRRGNDEVAAAVRRYPGRFIGYAVANPNYPDQMWAELERCFDDLGMRCIKLHTELHGYPFGGPHYEPALRFAHERRLPMLVHGVGGAKTLAEIAERYCHANLIVAHLACWDGVGDNPELDVVAQRPNVFGDIASSVGPYRSFERLVERVGAEKIIFGSDSPLHEPRAELGRVLLSLCTEGEKRLILSGNFLRLLRLEGWPPHA